MSNITVNDKVVASGFVADIIIFTLILLIVIGLVEVVARLFR